MDEQLEFCPFIYALVDPSEPDSLRYVGMATVRDSRPYDHAKWARRPSTKPTHVINWIRKLQREGREYTVLILEKFPSDTLHLAMCIIERCYINVIRSMGHPLTNMAEGGWGGFTGQEGVEKTRVASIGNTFGRGAIHPAEGRRSRSEKLRRYYEDPANREALSVAVRAGLTADSLARMRAAHIGAKRSSESCRAISAGRLANPTSAEGTESMAQAKRDWWARKKAEDPTWSTRKAHQNAVDSPA